MIASGPTTCILHFDNEAFRVLRPEQKQDMLYLMERLFNGERVADTAPGHFGVIMECEADSDGG
jgi:hypothetical protein